MSKMLNRSAICVTQVLAFLFVSGEIWASTLPNVSETLQVTASANENTYVGPFIPGSISDQGPLGLATSGAQINPEPVLSVFISITGGTGIATSGLDYYVEADGPTGQQVPLILTGAIIVATGGGGAIQNGAIAEIANVAFDTSLCNLGQITNSSCPFTIPVMVDPNTPVRIDLAVIAQSNGGPTIPGVVDATNSVTMDPTVSVDPSFADANLFTLAFSPGVGNTATTMPEPSTFSMLAVCCVPMGLFAIWRRNVSKRRS